MVGSVRPIPEGCESVIPYLVVGDAAKAIAFYKQALGAEELHRMNLHDGRIGHAELRIGAGRLMLADEFPEMDIAAPRPGDRNGVTLMIYVENVDAVVKAALDAGATLERPVADQFYGDRNGGIVDPFGHRWYIATHVEDVPPAELDRRAKERA